MEYKLAVIDRITKHFTDYIDSGFGLLQPDVAYLTTVLVTIDIILAGLFRALLNDQYIPNNLIQKTLYIGFFAFIINNYKVIADMIYRSFGQLGAKAGQASFSGEMLLRPGFIAETGVKTAGALLNEAGEQFFAWSFSSKLTAIILLFAGLFVIVAFLILSVHLFVAIVEFKLTTLVGFILVPFALFGKTTFLADRVLNTVVNAGIKLMILGVITGIGSSIFNKLTLSDKDITLEEAAAAVLASMAILALSYAITSLARSMVLGVPMLGADPAVRTQQVATRTIQTGAQGVGTATRTASDVAGTVFGRSRPTSDPDQSGTASHDTALNVEASGQQTSNPKRGKKK